MAIEIKKYIENEVSQAHGTADGWRCPYCNSFADNKSCLSQHIFDEHHDIFEGMGASLERANLE